MKMIITLVGIFLTGNIIVAQKKEFRQKALQEIDSLVANALEFLGKTDSVIMATGRPLSIIGGDKWEADLIKTPGKNSLDVSKSITVGTGCGALMMMVSEKTGLAYIITYIPHKKSKLTGADIWDHLNGKYEFDPKANAVIQARDSSYIGLSILAGAIMIVAFKNDRENLRFEK